MQLAACPTPAIVMNAAAYSISGTNQKLYLRLKTSLQLNLRRQIFLAVCDDLELRSHLVSQLQTAFGFPRFVSLNLNLSDPNPMVQVAQWLSQREKVAEADRSFGFQVLGVEHLTRQPASVQKRFLTHLQAIEYYLPVMDYTMLLWLPRPWLRSLQQSAPAFWDWHTALFEFEGDPAPLRNPNSVRLQNDRVPSRAIAQAHQPSISNQKHFSPDKSLNPVPIVPAAQIAIKPVENPQTSGSLTQAEEESIWDMLTYDLAQLDREPKSNSATYQHHKPITPPQNCPQTGPAPAPPPPSSPTPNPQPQIPKNPCRDRPRIHSPSPNRPSPDCLKKLAANRSPDRAARPPDNYCYCISQLRETLPPSIGAGQFLSGNSRYRDRGTGNYPGMAAKSYPRMDRRDQ
jgi:hypothetical protein